MLNRALYVLVVSCSLQPVSLFAQQEQEKGNAAEVPDQVTMDTEGTRGMNMALSPDGKTAAVNLTNGSILLCNALTGEVKSVLAGHQKWTWLTFSPDSRQLASGGSQDGQVRLWDVAAGRQIVQLPGHNTQVSMVDFSPDGKWLASAGFVLSDTDRDGEIKIWDIKTHQELFTLAADNGLTDIKFSRDGKYLASAEYAKKRIDLGPMSEVKIWDLKTHKIVKHIPNVCGLMSRLKFSPDGKTLAIGEYNGPVIHAASHRVQFVDTKNWQFQGALVGHTNRIFGLDYTPDGKTLVTSSSDGTLRVWDVKTRTLQKLVPTNTGNTGQLSLSKDGARFSFASKAPEVIRLGALKHNAEYLTGKMKSKSLEYIGAIRFSSDGKNLAVSRRRKAIYWDATTGTGLPPLSYFKQTPRAFSPDFRYAVTAYRTIDIWDITTLQVGVLHQVGPDADGLKPGAVGIRPQPMPLHGHCSNLRIDRRQQRGDRGERLRLGCKKLAEVARVIAVRDPLLRRLHRLFVEGETGRIARTAADLVVAGPPAFAGITDVIAGFLQYVGTHDIFTGDGTGMRARVFQLPSMPSGQQRRPRGTAVERTTKSSRKQHTFPGNAIEVGRLDSLVAVGTGMRKRLIVGNRE